MLDILYFYYISFLSVLYSEQDWPVGEKTQTIPFHYLHHLLDHA